MDLDTPQKDDYGAIWEAALNDYEETVGIDKQSLTKARCVNDVLREVKARESRFSEHRHDGGKLDRLRSAVSESLVPIERLGHVTAAIAGNVYPPAYSVLGAAQLFISNATTMSDDYDRVVKCFEDVKQYLARLEILEERVELTAAIKKSIIDVFTALLALFGIFAKYTKFRRTKKFVKNLVFGEDKELKDAYTRLQKMVEQEQRVIAYTTQGDVQQIKHHVTALQLKDRRQAAVTERIKYDTSTIMNDLDSLKVQTDTSTILQWLSSLNFLEKHRNISEIHQEGTGEWLLHDPSFQLFYQSKDIHSIWCSGIPGAGKTVLTSLAINFVEEWFQDPEVAIAYFYCDYKDSRTFSEIQFMSSIIKQLVEKYVRVPLDVRVFYDKHTRRSKPPNYDEWLTLLQSVISCYDKIFIFIDALDECAEKRRRKFLCVIKALNTSTRFFITSRDYLELQETFPEIKRMKIEAHDADVRTFIEAGFEVNENIFELISRDSTLKEDVINRICEKAAGMFLLAKLLFNYLCEQQNCQAARDCLRSLPSTVDDFYKEAIGRIEDKFETKKVLAQRALSYIYCSERPLTMKELLEALGVEHISTRQQKFTPPEANVLRNAAAGLISFATNGITSLVHYSLQEYFDRNPKALISDPELNLANTCLTYIMFSDLQKRPSVDLHELLHELPFLDYASNNFGTHMMAYQQNESMLQRFLIFLTFKRKVDRVIQVCLLHEFRLIHRTNSFTHLNAFIHSHSRRLSVLHFVARLGLCSIFEKLYKSGFYTEDIHRTYGTVLHMAAWYGHYDIAQFLVAQNISLDAFNEQGETALMFAIKHRHTSIVSILIEAGSDLNLFATESHPPLCLAVQSGSLEITSMLLKHCKIAALDAYRKLLLFYDAGRLGNQEIMQILLETKESHDTTELGIEALKGAMDSEDKDMFFIIMQDLPALPEEDRELNSLLYSKFCDKPILQSLLKLGANANFALASKEPLIIHWILNGDEDIMRLLLNHQADFDTVGSNSFHPLHCAVATNEREKVSLLLERGASPNSKDRDGATPLHCAVFGGNLEIIRILSEYGADWEIKDDEGWTPFHFAFSKKERINAQGRLNMAKEFIEKIEDEFKHPRLKLRLIEKEENIYLKISELGASLCDRFSYVDVDPDLLKVQLDYIDRSCKVRLESWEAKFVWHLSADEKDHKLIVEDYVSKKGLHGWSLIHSASETGHEELLKVLINLNVDVNAQFLEMTSLHLSLLVGNEANAKLLLQHGADVNILGPYSENALHVASLKNEYQLAKLLVDAGCDVNAADYWGKTALMLAIQTNESEDDSEKGTEGDPEDDTEGGLEDGSQKGLEDGSQKGSETILEYNPENVSILSRSSVLCGDLTLSIRDNHRTTMRMFQTSELKMDDNLIQSAEIEAINYVEDLAIELQRPFESLLKETRHKIDNRLRNGMKYKIKDNIIDSSESKSQDETGDILKVRFANALDNNTEARLVDNQENTLDDRENDEVSDTECGVGPRTKPLAELALVSEPLPSVLIVKLLLQNGASVNAASEDGCNALHRAAFFGNLQVMELLIEADSDIEVYAQGSFRPVDVAIAMGHEAAAQMLLDKGATLKADSHRVSIIQDDYDDQNSYDQLLSVRDRQHFRTVASLPRRLCQKLLEVRQADENLQEKRINEWTVRDLAELSRNDRIKQLVEENLGDT